MQRLVDEMVGKMNAMRTKQESLQGQCDTFEARAQKVQSISTEVANLRNSLRSESEKQDGLHRDLQVVINELQNGATKVQKRVRRDVNENQRRLDKLENKPEPSTINVDVEMADSLVPKVDRCLRKGKKAWKAKRAQEKEEDADDWLDRAGAEFGIPPTGNDAPDKSDQ